LSTLDTDVATLAHESAVQPALQAPAPPLAPLPAPDATSAEIAPMVEAMIVTSGRPVPGVRLAQALGLIAPDAPLTAPVVDGATTSSEPIGEAPAVVTRPKRARKAKGPADPLAVVAGAVDNLNAQYEATGRAFRIEKLAGGYRLMTLPAHRHLLGAFHGQAASTRLSKSAIETLAIIAYKQPITRAKLEAIRGVACGEVLRSLLERRLITVAGRSEELGRAMLYGTTKPFLEAFGLASLADLPAPQDFATLRRG
jgi:segregation and condensation protein B